MHEVGTRVWRRPAGAQDEGVLYAVFSSTWEDAVAAMPNPTLAQHFLRIQYTAQERRFAARYPDLERWVLLVDDLPVGRLYLHRTATTLHLVDISLLPEHRSRGIGTALVQELVTEAAEHGLGVTLRVPRAHQDALHVYERAGFRRVSGDDLDVHLAWTAPASED